MVDRKGIASFLIITFALTYSIEFSLIELGFRFSNTLAGLYGTLVITAVMWVPAIATIITVKFVTKEGFARTGLHFGLLDPYVTWGLLVPLCFIITNGLNWLLGIGNPDWGLHEFMSMIPNTGTKRMPPPHLMIAILFIASTFFSPLVNSVIAFGEELGWRGYLLPKLMPLGKARAYGLVGVIWGLWHLPLLLVGFGYPGANTFASIGVFILFTSAFGIVLNEVSLRQHSTIIASWLHGLFNSQRLGVWPLLFVGINPLIGGPFGVISLTIWLLVALVTVYRGRFVAQENQGTGDVA